MFKAHIFGHRRYGDRQEVRLKLFNKDGTEFSPGGRILSGVGLPNNQVAQWENVTGDDFSQQRLSDSQWWITDHPDYPFPGDGSIGGLGSEWWQGMLVSDDEYSDMRTTVHFSAPNVDISAFDFGATVLAHWDGPTDDPDHNFKWLAAWLTTNPTELQIKGHDPTGWYEWDSSPEITILENEEYWLRCSVIGDEIKAQLVTSEEAFSTGDIYAEVTSSIAGNRISGAAVSGRGGIVNWNGNIQIFDISVDRPIINAPGVVGDWYLDISTSILYGPRDEDSYPDMAFQLNRIS